MMPRKFMMYLNHKSIEKRDGHIIYLTPRLERAAQRHKDKIPRWDADYYVAEVTTTVPPVVENNHIYLKDINVTNVGVKDWPIATQNATILLGCRLVNERGKIISEGRSTLGNNDIQFGNTLSLSIRSEIPDNNFPHIIRIGVVWENKFWFDKTIDIRFI